MHEGSGRWIPSEAIQVAERESTARWTDRLHCPFQLRLLQIRFQGQQIGETAIFALILARVLGPVRLSEQGRTPASLNCR